MAAAEARAGWQRTANRGFVQEDARGAPKLSHCPPSSSKSESDRSPSDAAKGSDHPIPECMPHNQHSSKPDLLPETKRWLHLQSNRGHLKKNSLEQLGALEEDHGVLSAGGVIQTAKLSGENQLIGEYGIQSAPKTNAGSLVVQPWKAFATCMTNDQDHRMQELKAVISDNLQKMPMNKDMGEFWYADDHLMDLDPCNFLVSEQPEKICSELESHWIGVEKTGPWWRTADKGELASLVSHKSLEHFENCDLPRPHSNRFGRGPSACPQCFEQDKGLASLDQTAERSNLADYLGGAPTSVSIGKSRESPHCVDKPFSRNDGFSSTKADGSETLHSPNSNLSKAQLLEALCHSQTRAREAEKAAQEAYDEKEHIIKLFFRQASHLFAYKQWLQILQLETLCLQLRNKDDSIYAHFPVLLPWVPCKGKQSRKGRRKAAKRKLGPPRYKICKGVVAFAVGLSLAGAGLLLGWTMGWLFPAF